MEILVALEFIIRGFNNGEFALTGKIMGKSPVGNGGDKAQKVFEVREGFGMSGAAQFLLTSITKK